MYTKTDVIRFWSKVNISSGDSCWVWKGFLDKAGYGRFWISSLKLNTGAHRVSYWISTNIYPGNKNVCHSCDNPSCCNPKHLWLGTQQENIQDAINKNRINPKALRTLLTEKQVLEVKVLLANTKMLKKEIAEYFKVTRYVIYGISKGKTWKDV